MSSAGILNLAITSLPVDNFHDRALWCKSTGINYNMHGWILCRYCVTGWFWWISGLRAVTMWSSSSFTKTNTNQACMGSDAICVPYLLLLLPSGFDLITEPEVLIGVWSRAHAVCDRAVLSVDRRLPPGEWGVACKGIQPAWHCYMETGSEVFKSKIN